MDEEDGAERETTAKNVVEGGNAGGDENLAVVGGEAATRGEVSLCGGDALLERTHFFWCRADVVRLVGVCFVCCFLTC